MRPASIAVVRHAVRLPFDSFTGSRILIARIATQLEIPRRLRAVVRARESSLVALASLVGILAGLIVAAMGQSVDLLHEVFFDLEHGERLSARLTLNPYLAFSVPLVGGLIFGIANRDHQALASGT